MSRRYTTQYDDDHVRRCQCCGSWEIVTDTELKMRAAGLWPEWSGLCEHLEPHTDDWKEAS